MTTYAEMMQMCRLCLVKDQVNLPIFDGQGDIQQIFLKITACLPVKVSREDNLPKNICDGCGFKLDLLYQFWNTSSNSEKQLIDWLTAAGVDPKHTANEPIGLASQPNVILKQEPVTELDAISTDAQSYIMQQQQLAYKPESEYDESQQTLKGTKTKAASDSADEPSSKRPKRTTRNEQSVTEVDEESDEDYLGNSDANITKTEDESEEEEEEEDPYADGDDDGDADFVPGGEDSEQPGPSGVSGTKTSGPRRTDFNEEETVLIDTTSGPKHVPKKFVKFTPRVQEKVTIKGKNGQCIPLVLKSVPVVFKNKLPAVEKKTIKLQKVETTEQDLLSLDDDFEIRQKPSPRKKVRFICSECNKRFQSDSQLTKHRENLHVERNLPCPLCEQNCQYLVDYRAHIKTHEVDGKYICKYCERTLSTIPNLEAHIRQHTGDFKYKCNDCDKAFYTELPYRHHREAEHEGVRYPCEICGSIIKSKRYFKDHMRMHAKTDPKTYECDICHKYYATKCALNGHKRIHTGERYICDICGKESIQRGAHNTHMMNHRGEKPFICQVCGKDFLRKVGLDIHLRKYHECTPCISCNKCDNVFATEFQLMVHLQTHSDIEKRYACDLCDAKFIDLNFLRSHVNKVHIENIPADRKPAPRKRRSRKKTQKFVCYICDASFAANELLQEHFKTHEVNNDEDKVSVPLYEEITLETYSCNYCELIFDQLKDLNEHIASHTNDHITSSLEDSEVTFFYEECKEVIV